MTEKKEAMKRKMSDQTIRHLLEKRRQERLAKCREELQEILGKYRCEFSVSVKFQGGGALPLIELIALP